MSPNNLSSEKINKANKSKKSALPIPICQDSLPSDVIIALASENPATTAIPMMNDSAACGFPSPAEQYIESPLDLNKLLVKKPAATFYVKATGDSMVDAGIFPGDILVVDRSIGAMNGNIIIACVNNEFTVKYLKIKNHQVSLVAANSKYPEIIFNDGMELRIFGVVTSCIHRFVK